MLDIQVLERVKLEIRFLVSFNLSSGPDCLEHFLVLTLSPFLLIGLFLPLVFFLLFPSFLVFLLFCFLDFGRWFLARLLVVFFFCFPFLENLLFLPSVDRFVLLVRGSAGGCLNPAQSYPFIKI